MIVDLKTISSFERQGWLQAAVAPRPVCFASTIDGSGQVNLSPFQLFQYVLVYASYILYFFSGQEE